MLRPNKPKSENTWDPTYVVLNYLKIKNNYELTLEGLTHKLVTLLALASGQRLQTLSLIDIREIFRKLGEIHIKISARLKTFGRNKPQPFLRLPYFKKDANLCVASTLVEYLKRTESIRGSITSVFVTIKKPHKKTSTQTLGSWIKIVLNKSRIDTDHFTAHSTRHAVTSAAARKGLNFDTIRLAAGWSKNSRMLATVYNRSLMDNENSFAEKLIFIYFQYRNGRKDYVVVITLKIYIVLIYGDETYIITRLNELT